MYLREHLSKTTMQNAQLNYLTNNISFVGSCEFILFVMLV